MWFMWLLVVGLLGQCAADVTYVNEFAVEIDGTAEVAHSVAAAHGYRVIRQVKEFGDLYVFQHNDLPHRSKRSADDHVTQLAKDPSVKRVEQQHLLQRYKRTILHDKQVELPIRTYADKSVYHRVYPNDAKFLRDSIPGFEERSMDFNDPFYADQWYLNNYGQSGGKDGRDLNVVKAWKKGFTGEGVIVTVLDDGLDHTHEDILGNYDPRASADFNDEKQHLDPMPDTSDYSNSHGTRCAGEIAAAANNSVCGVGIAYGCNIGGIRILDGPITDLLESQALLFNNQYIHIFSASWGPPDDGKTMEAPHNYTAAALLKGVTEGRSGLGSIFSWATGNGGSSGDDCGADGYTSSIYTLSIGSVDDSGQSVYFSEKCSSTMAVVYTGGSHGLPNTAEYTNPRIKVVTTDINQGCIEGFQGTSAAAPLAAGCFALTLEANPDLTWRDMQYIVVETATIPGVDESWVINGAGYHVSHSFGFGALDCGGMVAAAQTWTNVPPQHVCDIADQGITREIEALGQVDIDMSVDGCEGDPDNAIVSLEHVQVHLKINFTRRGDIVIYIKSPAGTVSSLLHKRPKDDSAEGIDFTFMTTHHWGEDPRGTWTLTLRDDPIDSDSSNTGELYYFAMTLYGIGDQTLSAAYRQNHVSNDFDPAQTNARELSTQEVNNIITRETSVSRSLNIMDKRTAEEMRKRKQYREHNDVASQTRLLSTLDDNQLRNILSDLFLSDKPGMRKSVGGGGGGSPVDQLLKLYSRDNVEQETNIPTNRKTIASSVIGSSSRDEVVKRLQGLIDKIDGLILKKRATEIDDYLESVQVKMKNELERRRHAHSIETKLKHRELIDLIDRLVKEHDLN